MKQLFIVFFIFFNLSLSAQNLAPNPSFEDTVMCPNLGGQVDRAKFWYTVQNTPDYFHSCFIYPQFSVPSNVFGFQYPRTGEAYMGLWEYSSWAVYPEIIGAKLLSPLIIGEKYFINFYVCLAWNAAYGNNTATNKLGILFSVYDNFIFPPPINNYAHLFAYEIVKDSVFWTSVSGSIIADSAYQYVSIGNFFDAQNTDTIHLNNSNGYQAYYYIDDICISKDSLICNNTQYINEAEVNIFPNPSNGKISISNIPLDITKIEIFDTSSKLIKSIDLKRTPAIDIDLTNFASGIYLLRLKGESLVSFNKLLLLTN